MMIEVRSQSEANSISASETDIRVYANVTLIFDSGNSRPRVECYGSSQPRVVCSGNSQPRVVCSDSSQPRVVCSGNSQPRVECFGYVQMTVNGKVNVTATAEVRIRVDGGNPDISGGIVHRIANPKTPKEWCEHNGASVKKGKVTLYEVVRDNWKSSRGFDYTPGTIPVAHDWDDGVSECGDGLHFCARPLAALAFDSSGTKFVACPVKLKDLAITKNLEYPGKIKGHGCCDPVYECDDGGQPINAAN